MNTPLPATMIRSRYTPLLYLCAFVLIGMAGIALFAPWIAPHDPNLVDLTQKLHGPSSAYPLGTDQLGRCLLSRLIYGARIIALMLVQWVYYARMFRGMVMTLKTEAFIAAARVNGSSSWKIIRTHILPNILPPLLVIGTLEMGWAIMDISAMSFLGLGVQSPTAEWGAMIHEGKSYIRTNPELMIYPGLAIMLVIISFNLVGEQLAERFGVSKTMK